MTDTTTQAPARRRRKPPETPQQELQADAEQLESQAAATPAAGRKRRGAAAEPAPRKAPVDVPPLVSTAPDQQRDVGKLPMPDMQHGFQVIVNDLFESGFDVVKEWNDVRGGLEIKDALTPQRLRTAANSQEALADRAHQLFIIAKVEVQAYLRETEPTYGAIRENAVQSLERDKASGARTKQITDADVLAEAARLHPDEWLEICERRERAQAMLKQLENLASLARSRCYTVSSMANPSSRLGSD